MATTFTLNKQIAELVITAALPHLDKLQLARENYAGTPQGRINEKKRDDWLASFNQLSIKTDNEGNVPLGDYIWERYLATRPACENRN